MGIRQGGGILHGYFVVLRVASEEDPTVHGPGLVASPFGCLQLPFQFDALRTAHALVSLPCG
uniref:Uncharacterized protein n=1 Tax=Streptomyces auratus AGR0001 TaxID=1160718 RepID=J1SCD5_9ACTN